MKKIVILALFSLPLFGERFEIVGDTIKDFETGLLWQRESSSNTMNWSSAVSYCKNLNLAGYSNWRLPHIDELKSIVNYGAYNPATFNGFKLKTTDWHWSSTKHNKYSSYSWVVRFRNGGDSWDLQTSDYFAVCVRDL
jgi:hypothetical protein